MDPVRLLLSTVTLFWPNAASLTPSRSAPIYASHSKQRVTVVNNPPALIILLTLATKTRTYKSTQRIGFDHSTDYFVIVA